MRNICLVLAYDGTGFRGWQRQPSGPTVQALVEETAAKVINERVRVWGSGRTDAGVHALGQVANFKTACRIPCKNLVRALNDALPPTVRVKDAREVSPSFHARYDVRSKVYRYRILQAPICSPFLWRFVCHHQFPLDRQTMGEAAKLLEGEHDFTSFASAEGTEAGERPDAPPRGEVGEKRRGISGRDSFPVPAIHPSRDRVSEAGTSRAPRGMVRTVFSSRVLWRPKTSILLYEARADGFLHHMVRNIVGTLIEVGKGKWAPRDVTRILEERDRTRAGPAAPARGLCLVRVEY